MLVRIGVDMTRYTFASLLAVLCDSCHTKYEEDPETPIGEFCARCRKRLNRWTEEMFAEEPEPDTEDIAAPEEDAFDWGNNDND
jgi:endogenous inhibitor of DNA gyrase (YacG/DUF329 family)